MRKQLIKTVTEVMFENENVVCLLGDIGVYGFRDVFTKYPQRIYNIGILEQSTISLMAGMALTGLMPIFHTISPFIAERTLEQIKLDFGYQNLIGQFISVGGSYDYAALGLSHQSPGDVQALLSIPKLHIVVPGSDEEFDKLFKKYYKKYAGYYRLSESSHGLSRGFARDTDCLVKDTVTKTVILVVGPLLKNVIEITKEMSDVDVAYCNTIQPFREHLLTGKTYDTIIVVSPFYKGTMGSVITPIMNGKKYRLYDLSIDKNKEEKYGTKEQHDAYHGFDLKSLCERIKQLK